MNQWPFWDSMSVAILLVATAAVGFLIGHHLRRYDQRRRGRRRASAGIAAERRAEVLLARHGFIVSKRQARVRWSAAVDGSPRSFTLCADYLVERNGRKYVAEVKSGRLAPRLSHAPTRRQLLEYRHAFDVHDVLLVDMTHEQIHYVTFDGWAPSPAAHRRVAWIALGALLGVALTAGAISILG